MNLVFTFSLEQRALANIAITLWSQDDIRNLMSKSALHVLCNNWQEIVKAVTQKSFKLQLPEMLKKRLLCFIVRVGFQFLSWIDLHHHKYRYVTQLPATFVWTSLGTINNKETAKLLVMGDTLDGDMSFALACMYCLEDEIKYCWGAFNISSHISKLKYHFVLYWFNYMSELYRKENLLSSSLLIPIKGVFVELAHSGNEVAIRYFIKINMENFNFVAVAVGIVAHRLKFVNIIALQRYSELMLFLLSKLNIEKRAKLIVNRTYAILRCFLFSPWHNLFLETVKHNWNSLSKDEYKNLLYDMVALMRYEHNLHELFGEFWQHSPKDYKEFIANHNNIVSLLIDLYNRGDETNVKLILKDSSISTRKNILNIKSKEIFIHLVFLKKWDSIKFLIQECLSSQEDLIAFRDVFKNYVQDLLLGNRFWYLKFDFKECQWDNFFQLVDVFILGYNTKKRRTEYNNT